MENNIRDTQPLESVEKQRKFGFFTFIYIVNLAILAGVLYMLFSKNLFPLKYRGAFLIVSVLIQALIGKFIIWPKGRKFLRFLAILFMANAIFFNSFALAYMYKGFSVFDKISNKTSRNVDYSIIVRKDSPYEEIKDLEGVKIGISNNIKDDKVEALWSNIEEETGVSLESGEKDNMYSLVENLLAENEEAILINESYRDYIEEKYKDFPSKTRILKTANIKVESSSSAKSKEVKTNKSFNIYISGIDTYGSIDTISRSDVNLILSVNPKTHEILISSVPRDTYARIAGDGHDEYDKLTHAGLYGVESSIETLENLLDITINYYARVNFTSLVEIVDVLGGIEVENVEEFGTKQGYYFPEGKITLNGDEALAFSRERYHLEEGEIGRGKNQERVLTGMIRKAMSPAILFNYTNFLGVITQSVETNISDSKIIELVNAQISEGAEWKISSTYVKGEPSYGLPSYAMPDAELFMFVPDEESIKETHDKITSTLKGN